MDELIKLRSLTFKRHRSSQWKIRIEAWITDSHIGEVTDDDRREEGNEEARKKIECAAQQTEAWCEVAAQTLKEQTRFKQKKNIVMTREDRRWKVIYLMVACADVENFNWTRRDNIRQKKKKNVTKKADSWTFWKYIFLKEFKKKSPKPNKNEKEGKIEKQLVDEKGTPENTRCRDSSTQRLQQACPRTVPHKRTRPRRKAVGMEKKMSTTTTTNALKGANCFACGEKRVSLAFDQHG